MAEKQEIADIIAEMRFHGQQNIDAEKDKPEYGILTVEGRIAQNYADRLEAAYKREKSAIEAEALSAGGMVEAERTNAEKSSVVGDCAKMREALKSLMDDLRIHAMMPCQDITMNHAEVDAMIEDCRAALAKPPRNCDVGTEQEQARRFLKYCVKQDCEKACPFRDCKNSYECAFGWAQMPYEEGGDS